MPPRNQSYSHCAYLIISALLLTSIFGAFVTPALANTGSLLPVHAPGSPVFGWGKLSSGMNNTVYSMAFTNNGTLYAGGSYTTAGGVAANRIAQWDESAAAWFPVGSGMNDYVLQVFVDSSNRLYAAGDFTTPANHIALWNGTAWTSLGAGVDGRVWTIAENSSGNLYVGGNFTTADGVSANRVAMWNGSTWSPLGVGTNNFVKAMIFDSSGNLYAGGRFTNAGGIGANRVAMWDGVAWSALGSGVNNQINALAIGSDGDLYAGGRFTTAGGASANYIARWDGASWSPLGSGTNGYVTALTVGSDGTLYVGGAFTAAGGVSANRIAKWDGSSWSAIDTGVGGTVYGLALDSDENLYLGGRFTSAGTRNPRCITVYGQSPEVSSVAGSSVLTENAVATNSFSQITVTYTEDMMNPVGDTSNLDVTNPANYGLLQDGTTPISIDSVSYTNNGGSGPFTATVNVNGGVSLPNGSYAFMVKGSSTVFNMINVALAGDGVTSGTDMVRNFSIAVSESADPTTQDAVSLPASGFTPGQVTRLPVQPADKAYAANGGLQLQIPSLGVMMPIAGVPLVEGEWDVSWLGNQAGHLSTTAYPTWNGNTVLAGHVWDANNTPGPFAELSSLPYGDEIHIFIGGSTYTYQVQDNYVVSPDDLSVLKHKDYDWLTLVTCQSFNEETGEYDLRRVVQAVRVRVDSK